MLVVIHPRCLDQYRGNCGEWVYADEKLETLQRVEKALGLRLKRLISPAEFQTAAAKLRKCFVEWIDANLRDADQYEWLLTPLYKNPFANNLFLHCVWLALIVEQLEQSASDLVVVTSSPALARALRQNALRLGVSDRCIGRVFFVSNVWTANAWGLLGLGYRVFNLGCRALVARVILGKSYVTALPKTEMLIDTFIHDGDLSEDGVFNDRYFPGVIQCYLRHGLKSAYYPFFHEVPLRSLPEVYRRMLKSTTLFAPFERFIQLFDLLAAAVICFRRGLRGTRLPYPLFEGSDAAPLAAGLAFQAAVAGFLPLVLVRAPARLAAAGIRPTWLLEWFENQPIDKANIIGFQKTGAQCNVIAARQYIAGPNFLSLYTTSGEVDAGVAPLENWVMGQALVETASVYDRRGQYRAVPALRYAHLHRPLIPAGKQAWLLVLLTHALEESLAILDCIASELPTIARQFERIAIKPHPDNNSNSFRSVAEARWPGLRGRSDICWTEESLFALFAQVRLVVTGGSSSALETICQGIPVILVGRDAGLDINPLEGVAPQMWALVYEPKQLSSIIEQWSPAHPLPPETRKSLGREVRDAFFEPITDVTLKAFLPAPLTETPTVMSRAP